MSLPLAGLRVLDLTRLLPGPLCTLWLADLGAEIIKIEAPEGGDYARWYPPIRQQMSGIFAALNRNLNKTVQATLSDVDVVLFLVEAGRYGPDDAQVLALLPKDKPVILVANKLDMVHRREDLFPWLQTMQGHHPFAEFIPLTATKDEDAKRLADVVRRYLPEQGWWYDAEALTDRTDRFMVSEMIREKLFRLTGDELPYTSTVVIDSYKEEPPLPGKPKSTGLVRVAATIIVEREQHKGMIIGDKGEKLKRIGTEARTELERLIGSKVFLEIWVKVRSGWADDDARLRTYGYE